VETTSARTQSGHGRPRAASTSDSTMNLCGACGFAVELAIRVFIGRSVEPSRDTAGKNTSWRGVAQNFRAHICISVGGSRAAFFGPAAIACVPLPAFTLVVQEAACATVVSLTEKRSRWLLRQSANRQLPPRVHNHGRRTQGPVSPCRCGRPYVPRP